MRHFFKGLLVLAITGVVSGIATLAGAQTLGTISGVVKSRERAWIVVADDGMGTFQLWPKHQ